MELKQLRYFLHICEASSLSEAAHYAGVSQPALSRQIRLLEEEIGLPLLIRHSRGIVLSEAGEQLRADAVNLLKEASRIQSGLAAAALLPRGELAIGAPSSLQRYLIAPSIAQFLTAYSDVRFRVQEGTSRAARDALVSGSTDLAVLSTLEDLEPLDAIRLATEPLFLIGPRRAKLRMEDPLAIEGIVNLPLILTARPNSLRLIVDRALARRSLAAEAKVEVESLQMALNLIDMTGCYSIFPFCAIDLPLRENRITAAPIKGLHISWAIATMRERRQSTATRLFIRQLIDECERKIKAGEWPMAVLNI